MPQSSISYKRHRFPPELIAHAVWHYVRFNLSMREVDEMLLERGIDVSYETIRRWTVKFGPRIARCLRRRQPRPGDIWHLDEVAVKIAGRKSGSGERSISTVWFLRKSSSASGTSGRPGAC